jgi:hypothetical protein
MLSADYRAAKALMELRLTDGSDRAYDPKAGRSFSKAPELGPGYRLLRRLAVMLVSLGGRLVRAGLPPYRPAGVEKSA